MSTLAAGAQDSPAKRAVREVRSELDAPTVSKANARDAIQIEATSENSTASLKASTKLDDGTSTTRMLSLVASAPIAKGESAATLASAGRLKSGTTLGLSYTQSTLAGVRVPGEETFNLCIEYQRIYTSIAGNKAESFVCDTATVKELAEKEKISWARYRDFRSAFFGPDAAIHSWSVTLSGGYRDAKYFEPATLKEQKERKKLAGLDVTYSYVPLEATQLFAATLGVASGYKDGKSTTACLSTPPAGSTLLDCVTGPIGVPKKQDSRILDLEWRRKISERHAFSLLVSRDFKEKVTSVGLPLYIVGNDKDGLSGGIRLDWNSDDKKTTIGVFVGKAFSVQP
jgi:hypothetical protein